MVLTHLFMPFVPGGLVGPAGGDVGVAPLEDVRHEEMTVGAAADDVGDEAAVGLFFIYFILTSFDE
jgi:hypothetical protein